MTEPEGQAEPALSLSDDLLALSLVALTLAPRGPPGHSPGTHRAPSASRACFPERLPGLRAQCRELLFLFFFSSLTLSCCFPEKHQVGGLLDLGSLLQICFVTDFDTESMEGRSSL